MKKLFTFLVAGLLVFCTGTLKADNVLEIKECVFTGDPVIVRYGIEFGSPRRQCDGFGFCIVYVYEFRSSTEGENNVNSAVADFYFDTDGVLVAEFLKAHMQEKTMSIYFDNYFKVEDPFVLPVDMLSELNHSGSYTIQPGNYVIEDRNDKISVKFK